VFELGRKGKDFSRFLHSGNEVMKQLLHIIMKTAPVGLGAYFAYQVGILGHNCLSIRKTIRIVLCGLCFYFVVFFSLYAYMAGGKLGFKVFWKTT
jgi:Na+/H+-dicarboxylate symporter